MDQMADEMTLRADVKDKRRVNSAEESSSCLRGERVQSEAQVGNGRLSAAAEKEPADSSRETDAQRPTESDSFTAPLFSLKTYLRRSSSAASSSTKSLSSSQQSNMGVDCAEMVLNCLFCRFYNVMRMLPCSCERAAHHCCPNYKQALTTATTPSTDDDACIDLDCGLLSSCQDASDCLELAMEVSEICYH